MTQNQALLFRYLRQNAGRPISREELAKGVWQQPYRGTTRTIDQNIAMLRKKLQPADGRIITVWAVGYRFEPPEKHQATLSPKVATVSSRSRETL